MKLKTSCTGTPLCPNKPLTTLLSYILLLIFINTAQAQQQQQIIGTVIDARTDQPVIGATVKLKPANLATHTDEDGRFTLPSDRREGVLEILHLGYQASEFSFKGTDKPITIALEPNDNVLKEVIVSTGYQSFKKGEATGSISVVDSATYHRSNATNLLERLDGVASGLVFNRNKAQNSQSDVIIRGRSTLFADDKPLVVVDNFPYDGDLDLLNPNDIQQISILKDAAAASIWGTRAGNGVIVITTKKGALKRPPMVNFHANGTIGQKPDLFGVRWLDNEEWLSIEQSLFRQNAYFVPLYFTYRYISPAVEIMDAASRGQISSADSAAQLNALKPYDVRHDMAQYLYRVPVNQQYQLDISGGSDRQKYYVSASYDDNRAAEKTNSFARLTLNARNSFYFSNEKLEVGTGLFYSNTVNRYQTQSFNPKVPYERLVDDQGNALAVSDGSYRRTYTDTAGNGALLDWQYRPLAEMAPDTRAQQSALRISTSLAYQATDYLKLSLLYQFSGMSGETNHTNTEGSYYTRDLVNRYSSIDYRTGEVLRPVPEGAVVNLSHANQRSHNGRLQAELGKRWPNGERLTAIAGLEVRHNGSNRASQRFYGYQEETGISGNSRINHDVLYPLYYYPSSTSKIESGSFSSFGTDRYVSLFLNASYTFRNRYTVSGSARKDESNLFGVKPNRRGVPLWSTGIRWDMAKEPWYKLDALPVLSLRASFGYSGNVSKRTSSYLTANAVSNLNQWGLRYNEIINPPNPSLGWEKINVINTGLDIATRNHRLAVSIEPYWKYGIDLIGESPLAPQVGLGTYISNSASTYTHGVDISVQAKNVLSPFQWYTSILFSYNKDKTTDYRANSATNIGVIRQTYDNPVPGYPYYSLFAFRSAGLDETGAPLVYYDEEVGTEYAAVKNSTDRSNLVFMGSSVPQTSGSLLNRFVYREWELSFNITYRLGYSFRRASLNNGQLYGLSGFMYADDYERRWQNAGDESRTNVPALVYPSNTHRDDAYTYADVLIEKADNVKFQDIRLAWDFPVPASLGKGIRAAQIYLYASNLGYLWKGNKYGLDPDNPRPSISSLPMAPTVAFGLKMTL